MKPKENVKFSIVIPAYNIEKYILRCLKSVAAQDYSNYEVIIVNDGSTDNTEAIIKEYINDKKNFVLSTQENRGLSGARNSGMKLCSGEYVMFLDGDDEIEPNMLFDLSREISANDLDAIFFDAVYIDKNGHIDEQETKNYDRPNLSDDIQTGKSLFSECMKKQKMLVCACFYAFRKDLINKYNLEFFPGIFHEDCLFTPWLMFACNKVKHVNKLYYRYYCNGNSIMTSKNDYSEAKNYGIVTNELLKKYKNASMGLKTRYYYRNYLISMYNMGRVSYNQITSSDKNLGSLYEQLAKDITGLQRIQRVLNRVQCPFVKIRNVIKKNNSK